MVNSDLLKALQKAKPQKKPSLVTKTSSTQSRVLRQVCVDVRTRKDSCTWGMPFVYKDVQLLSIIGVRDLA